MLPRILLLVCCALASAEAETQAAPTLLHTSSVTPLSVPGFAFFGSPRSDLKGNIFIHPPPFEEVNILKISPSSDTTVYKLSDEQAKKYSFYDYSVTPSGVVWALVNAIGSPELRAVEFDSHGEPKIPTRLDLPDNIGVSRFLALDSGVLFLLGAYTEKASAEQRGRAFMGIFDGSGRLIRSLRNNLPLSDPVPVGSGVMREGDCTTAEDGNAYFLGSDNIVTINPAGEVIRRTPFKKPAPDLLALGLNVSNGWAAITFKRLKADNTFERSSLVIELATGRAMGWYQAPTGVGYAAATGFSLDDGFTFFANDNGKIKLVTAKLR